MKTYQLKAEARKEIGKQNLKKLRNEGYIPAVLNGGKIVDLPYKEALKDGEKVIELQNGKGMLTTDIMVKADDVRKLIYTPDIFEIDLELNGEKRKAVMKICSSSP